MQIERLSTKQLISTHPKSQNHERQKNRSQTGGEQGDTTTQMWDPRPEKGHLREKDNCTVVV